jgi:O-antigen/teichoic acid export membrane protein
MKEIVSLSVKGEFGKIKTLVKGVFIGIAVLLIIASLLTKAMIPMFMERIRLQEGSLVYIVITTAFFGCIAPVYTNVLQALKKFKEISLINIFSAPVRLITMTVTMPFRAICGYFVGQAAAPAFSILLSLFFLRKFLAIKSQPYWNIDIFRRFGKLFIGVTAYQLFPMISGLVDAMIIRQRLPEVESGAYYMITRFSEIACFLNGTLLTVMFPFTAELAERKQSTKPLVIKAAIATLIFGLILAGVFLIAGEHLLAILPSGDAYSRFAWAIPCMIIMTTMLAILSYHTNTEISAGRFGFLKWWIPFHLLCPIFLLVITGYKYFTPWMPQSWMNFLSAHNFTSLQTIIIWLLITGAIKLIISSIEFIRNDNNKKI